MNVDLRQRVTSLVAQHGGLRAAARVLKIDGAYLSRLKNGVKTEPSLTILKKLGLMRGPATYYDIRKQARRV